MTQDFQEQTIENTSGQGENAIVPPEVANRFNWGAFFLNWNWLLWYRQKTAVIISLCLWLLLLIPILGPVLYLPLSLALNIWFGTQGNKWAWQTQRYSSVKEFHRVHKKISAFSLLMVLPITLGIVAAMTIPTLMNSTNDQMFKVGSKKAMSILTQGTQIAAAKEEKITDTSSEGIAKYFLDNAISGKMADNRILGNDGIGYIFESDGSCTTPNSCSILVDVNGAKGPNEEWTEADAPKDRVRIYFEIQDGYVVFKTPEVVFPKY